MGIFWRQNQTLQPLKKENKDYLFTEIILAEEKVNAIKLLDGPYANVVYYYGHVKVVPEGTTHRLAYQYTIWDSASFTKAELVNSTVFTTLIGDILVAIIADENNSGEYNGPTRSDNSEEPDIQ
jgi:hypothetical protein